jgi:hypothetical protein
MSLGKKKMQMQGTAGITATDHFAPVLYNGNGSTQSISVGFASDLVFIKNRTVDQGWSVWDTVRGASSGYLETQNTNAELNAQNMLTFDSDGFNVSTNGGAYTQTNRSSSSDKYVSYSWKGGGTAVSNTDGSITSSVSANPDAGFSIVKFTKTAGNSTVGHGLGVKPSLVITKKINGTGGWTTYTDVTGSHGYLQLNTTAAFTSYGSAPNTSTFNNFNDTSDEVICYVFADVDSYQKIGTYTGTGSEFNVNIGFQPRWVMIKRSGASGAWHIYDEERGATESDTNSLAFSSSSAEASREGGNDAVFFTSTGFTVPDDTGNGFNSTTSGNTYLYWAIA